MTEDASDAALSIIPNTPSTKLHIREQGSKTCKLPVHIHKLSLPYLEPPRNEAAPIGTEESSSPKGHISCWRAQPGASPSPLPLFWMTIPCIMLHTHHSQEDQEEQVLTSQCRVGLPKVTHATVFIRLSSKTGLNTMSDRLIRRCVHTFIRLSSKAGPNAMSDRLIRRCVHTSICLSSKAGLNAMSDRLIVVVYTFSFAYPVKLDRMP